MAFPFGLSNAPNIFNRGADLLEWAIAVSDSVSEDDIHHFYDDFFEVGTLISVKILSIPVQRSVNF